MQKFWRGGGGGQETWNISHGAWQLFFMTFLQAGRRACPPLVAPWICYYTLFEAKSPSCPECGDLPFAPGCASCRPCREWTSRGWTCRGWACGPEWRPFLHPPPHPAPSTNTNKKSKDSTSSGSRNFGEGGPRNMKYKPLCAATIFVWPTFIGRGGGAWPPWPPWIRYCSTQSWSYPSSAALASRPRFLFLVPLISNVKTHIREIETGVESVSL